VHGMVDSALAEDHRESLLREAEERRLARDLRGALRSRVRRSAGGRDADIMVRWGLHADEDRVAELLELNGMPRWTAFEERFVVAERDGVVLAALAYRTEPKRMLIETLVADPWAGERGLAVALYAGVRELAREMCVREISASTGWHAGYLREAGYRRGMSGWFVDAAGSSHGDVEYPPARWRSVPRLILRFLIGKRAYGG